MPEQLYCAASFVALNPDMPLLCTRDMKHTGPHATTVGEMVYCGPERDGQRWPMDYGADCLPSERHPKWQRVEPGTVIPAGQPHRVEYFDGLAVRPAVGDMAMERTWNSEIKTTADRQWFIDSSWKPPLVLPTEPTWGIAVNHGRFDVGQWWQEEDVFRCQQHTYMTPSAVQDFLPLTDEQVARIEAAR